MSAAIVAAAATASAVVDATVSAANVESAPSVANAANVANSVATVRRVANGASAVSVRSASVARPPRSRCRPPEDASRARHYGHLHVDDVAERAELFENEAVVLTHLTLRATPDELRRAIARRLPPALASRAVPFLPG